MAVTIEPAEKKYVDLPLTEFPVKEDTKKRMMDINSVLMPVVTQYNSYFAQGNLAACNDLIKNNPDVLDCFFNAEKWNWTRDAIIALQRFYLEDVVTFINAVAQNTVGIEDNPADEQASLVAYSAAKVNSLFDRFRSIRDVTIPVSGFENNVFTYHNDKILAGYAPEVRFSEESIPVAVKARVIVKTYDGYMTFKVKKMPAADLFIESISLMAV